MTWFNPLPRLVSLFALFSPIPPTVLPDFLEKEREGGGVETADSACSQVDLCSHFVYQPLFSKREKEGRKVPLSLFGNLWQS